MPHREVRRHDSRRGARAGRGAPGAGGRAHRGPDLAEPDPRKIRARFGITQTEFARLMGISVGTLRNWEQGIRRPEGAARVLLHVVERHPEVVRDVCLRTRSCGASHAHRRSDDE